MVLDGPYRALEPLPWSLGSKPLDLRRRLSLTTQLLDPFEPALDVAVQFRAVVPIICECGVDLSKRQVRMLEVKLLRTPSIRLLLDT